MDLKTYIKDWENMILIKRTKILNYISGKCSGLALCGAGLKKVYIIYYKDILFVNKKLWTLLGITDEPDGNLKQNELYSIHEYLFNIIKSTHKDNNI